MAAPELLAKGGTVSSPPLLRDLVVLLSTSLPLVFVCQKVGLPAVVGFLLTGVVIGPNASGLISSVGRVQALAEIGVALLLFTIGLEFSLARLLRMRRMILGAGSIQLFTTAAAVAGVAMLLDHGAPEAVVIGLIAALSSTAIVLKVIAERGELQAPHGQVALAILLFQDISCLPILILLPLLGPSSTGQWAHVGQALGLAVVATVTVFPMARRLVPAVLTQVLRLRSRELFIGMLILMCLGAAWLTASLGASVAIGAFIAGVVISESEYSHQAVAEVLPLRDLFSSLFFLSIGMLLDTAFVFAHPVFVGATLVGLISLKLLTGISAVLPYRPSVVLGVTVGAMLAQVGEFSFVIADQALELGILRPETFQGVLAVSVFSMVLTPLVGAGMRKVVGEPEGLSTDSPARRDAPVNEGRYVLIIGYGMAGQNLTRVFRETSIPYCVLDFDAQPIEQARADGHPCVYGDATRRVVLEHVRTHEAAAVVVAVGDPATCRRVVALVHDLNPTAAIVVRTHYVAEIEELHTLGASEVVSEEFESSLELFARVLTRLDVPRNLITAQVDLVRSEHYALLREDKSLRHRMDSIYEIFLAATTITHLVRDGSPVVGLSLGTVDLRGRSGVLLIALVRGGKAITNPGMDLVLAARDILVLLGNHGELAAARAVLEPPDSSGREGVS